MYRVLSVFFAVLLAACGDLSQVDLGEGGGSARPPDPAEVTGVQAFGTITRLPNGQQTFVTADLAVLTAGAGGARYIGGVSEPRLVLGEESVPLLTTETAGVFAVSNVQQTKLTWVPGAEIEYRFRVTDTNGDNHDFRARVLLPTQPATVELEPTLIRYAGEPLEMQVSQLADGGAIRVMRAGKQNGQAVWIPTWNTFRYDGPASIGVALQSMQSVKGPRITIPGTAFPEPGLYRIDLTSARILKGPADGERMSATFGPQSWFATGDVTSFSVEVE